METHWLVWLGIVLCIAQSGTLSGLNLALFGVSKMELDVRSATGNRAATRLLELRHDANFLLSTILWANVGSNVLLTLLSDSVLTGVAAFAVSTFLITFGGEIIPQAYFSRHVLQVTELLAPVLRVYQFLLYPIAKPTGMLLDFWLGKEGFHYFRETEMREVLRRHIASNQSDVGWVEGLGALNFLALDDLLVSEEGETVDPESIIELPVHGNRPVFPDLQRTAADPFLQRVQASGKKWIILTSPENEPVLALNSDEFLRAALFATAPFNPYACCHRPILVRDTTTPLGEVILRLRVYPQHPRDDVIDDDIILVWGDGKRVITGADILGRLLRGIVRQQPPDAQA